MLYKKICFVGLSIYATLTRSVFGATYIEYALTPANNQGSCSLAGPNDRCIFHCDAKQVAMVYSCRNAGICEVHCEAKKCFTDGVLTATNSLQLTALGAGEDCFSWSTVHLPSAGNANISVILASKTPFRETTINAGRNTNEIYINCFDSNNCELMTVNAQTAQSLYLDARGYEFNGKDNNNRNQIRCPTGYDTQCTLDASGGGLIKFVDLNATRTSCHIDLTNAGVLDQSLLYIRDTTCTVNATNGGEIVKVDIDTSRGYPYDIEWDGLDPGNLEATLICPDDTNGVSDTDILDPSTNACFNSKAPTKAPTVPSYSPSFTPSQSPTFNPTNVPSHSPSFTPSKSPTLHPTNFPSYSPSFMPSKSPTHPPSFHPSESPSFTPTDGSKSPTVHPTSLPTFPSYSPSFHPSKSPSFNPTFVPSSAPTTATEVPTRIPSVMPTNTPSGSPTTRPTKTPTRLQDAVVVEMTTIATTNNEESQDTAASAPSAMRLYIRYSLIIVGLILCLCIALFGVLNVRRTMKANAKAASELGRHVHPRINHKKDNSIEAVQYNDSALRVPCVNTINMRQTHPANFECIDSMSAHSPPVPVPMTTNETQFGNVVRSLNTMNNILTEDIVEDMNLESNGIGVTPGEFAPAMGSSLNPEVDLAICDDDDEDDEMMNDLVGTMTAGY